MGNLIFLYASMIPLMFLFFGLLLKRPGEIKGKKIIRKDSVNEGETIEVKINFRIDSGIGPVIFYDELPSDFELVKGNNFRLFWKGVNEKSGSYSYKVKCLKRGDKEIGSTVWTSEHILKLKTIKRGSISEKKQVRVYSKTSELEEVERRHVGDLPTPKSEPSKLGIKTTEFKEIREYYHEDPLSMINWKATAKRGKKTRPLVNEYEYEGERTIWIFLDADIDLRLGDTITNLFDGCVEATIDTAKFFTERRYLLGIYIYNSNKEILHPETGKKQYNEIRKKLTEQSCTDVIVKEGFKDAVKECRSFLSRYKPLPIVITSLSKKDESFKDGCKLLRDFIIGESTRRFPIWVIDVQPYSLNPRPQSSFKNNAALINSILQKPIKNFIKKNGGVVIEWDPASEDFQMAFLREVSKYQS